MQIRACPLLQSHPKIWAEFCLFWERAQHYKKKVWFKSSPRIFLMIMIICSNHLPSSISASVQKEVIFNTAANIAIATNINNNHVSNNNVVLPVFNLKQWPDKRISDGWSMARLISAPKARYLLQATIGRSALRSSRNDGPKYSSRTSASAGTVSAKISTVYALLRVKSAIWVACAKTVKIVSTGKEIQKIKQKNTKNKHRNSEFICRIVEMERA